MESEGSWPANPVNERVYVAVGSNVEESRLTLQWALENFGGDFRIIHIHSPSPDSPGARYPVPEVRDVHAMQETLAEYVRICHQAKISVEKRWIEMRDIGKGIVELIEQHAVTKLVMGAAADKHYTEGMTELKSTKAKFVEQHAHPSCHIWFICNGHLIHVRKGDLITLDMDAMPSWRPARSSASTVQSGARSPSAGSVHSSYSGEIVDDLSLIQYEGGEGSGRTPRSNGGSSYEEDRQLALLSVLEENGNDDLYKQLDRAMVEAANAKQEALEELLRRQKAERNAHEADRRARAYENLYSEVLRQKKGLEESLAKEKEDFENFRNRQPEELSAAQEQKMLLESEIAGTEHMMQELREKVVSTEELLEVCKKEREAIQVHLENALKVNEELLTCQAEEPSASHRHQGLMEFTFSEIHDATDNFDPSMKLEEGDYGSIYKGILRHTPVSIKMLPPDSPLGPSKYHQEVELVSKLRHPNMLSLVGVCPDAWALIYEHLPNGSLEDRFSGGNNSTRLSWQDRVRISTEICSALIFLHSCIPNPIVHGDLKPKNILLDSNSVSKLKDLRIQDQISSNTSVEDRSRSSGESSVESDVYSFGLIVLQLLTGSSAPNLVEEVQDALIAGVINDILDETAGDWPFFEAMQLAQLAVNCCDILFDNRPDLRSEVWPVLDSIRASCRDSASASAAVPASSGTDPNEPPSYLCCPISHDIMEDPLVAADGFTYEAAAIRHWLNSGNDTSPMTNLQLENLRLIPNRAIHSAIEEWSQNH